MREINVYDFSENLVSTFRRYLFTFNLIADSEPELRREVWRALNQEDVFVRRPLITCIPAYKQSLKGEDLLTREEPPRLAAPLKRFNPKEFDLGRSLYEHQAEALAKAQGGRNLIVATGTGSGKTECFLLPVLDDAARQPEPGVRSIIVYPMNALANDQLDRMRRLLKDVPEVTFGRYTGDTPWDRSELSEDERSKIAPNEKYTREELRETPPQILLTNFAMLEYLLLRPGDADLFRHQRLRYVVLDEAHTYNGAQGIDVALLMRRLREAFKDNDLQFILTSATLAEGDTAESRAKIARFGRSVTGADFSDDDIIFGRTVHGFSDECCDVPPDVVLRVVPDESAFVGWLAALEDPAELRRLVSNSGLPNAAAAVERGTTSSILYTLFRDLELLRTAHREVSENPRSFDELTRLLWGRDDRESEVALQWLLIMGSYARERPDSAPLLPVRFHFFFRGLNGASICLSPDCPGRQGRAGTAWGKVYLEDRTRCEPPCEKLLMPLLTCFQCGMPAVSAWVADDGKSWQSLRPSKGGSAPVAMTWDNSVSEEADEDEEGESSGDVSELCISCGHYRENSLPFDCCESPSMIRLRRLNTNSEGELKQCPRCGASARPFPSILRDFRSGEEAATAVIAEQMLRSLPDDEERPEHLPARGRRMLAFSDSRQRAAFFAPYLKRTTAETEYSKPLLDALRLSEEANGGDPVTLEVTAKRFLKEAVGRRFALIRTYDSERDVTSYQIKATRNLGPDDRKNIKRQAYISLLQHFCASPRRRLNMPGMGVASAEVFLTDGAQEDLPGLLPEIFARGQREGFDLLQQLLQIFLIRRAIRFDDDSITARDIGEGPAFATFHRELNDRVDGRQRYRWNPYAANKPTQRTIGLSFTANVIAKFFGLDVHRDEEKVGTHLTKIWDALRETTFEKTDFGGEYQVDAGNIVLTTRRPWRGCDRCGRLTTFNVAGVCVAPGCEGRVTPIGAEEMERKFERHHYRHRLLKSEPLALEVAEHTAQLTNKHGQEYQDKFIKGEINVLSSSTTFEMGVDVGALKAVFLRNIPPTASNYIQRAGRAGRRKDGAAYAVTYSRSMPHDQFYFHNPNAIVRGKIAVPLINLKNTRLAQRHVNSFLLGRYLRTLPDSRDSVRVADFFLNPDESSSPASRFQDFIGAGRARLLDSVRRVLPSEAALDAAQCLETSWKTLYSEDPESVFLHDVKGPLDDYEAQFRELQALQTQAAGNTLAGIGRAQESVNRLIEQLKSQRLIDFLAGSHWLPSYAFPQDVIRLLVRQKNWASRMRLERDREVGIAEYAPGAEIIADGRLFKSRGVVRRGRAFDVRRYRFCPQCRTLERRSENERFELACQCGFPLQPKNYIKPEGFTTFYDDEVPEPNLYRMRPPSNTELFLVAGAPPESFRAHEAVEGVTYGYRKDGVLFRANPGYKSQQYRLCKSCGVQFEEKARVQATHVTPWGGKCGGSVFRTHLAHEFETDTLQLRFDQHTLRPPQVMDAMFWLSFQTAFVSAAAEVLSIPRADLDGTYRAQTNESTEGELIVYDRVPGGAGYVERIIESLPQILAKTLERTRNCDNPLCDPEGSCYTCLRSYGNQFHWDKLQRRVVVEWLERVAGEGGQGGGRGEGASVPDPALQEAESLTAYCDERCRNVVRTCASEGLPLPSVGYELEDDRGSVCAEAELAWPDKKLALLLPEQSHYEGTFGHRGWATMSALDAAADIASLAERLRRG